MYDELRIDRLETRVTKLEDIVSVLRDDVSEIKALLPSLATREDVLAVSNKIDQAVSGLLREALASVPAKQVVLWTSISAIVAIVGLALAFTHLI